MGRKTGKCIETRLECLEGFAEVLVSTLKLKELQRFPSKVVSVTIFEKMIWAVNGRIL